MQPSIITKKDIAKELSIYMGWTKKKSERFIESMFNWIKKEMNNQKKIIITGIGSFQLNKRKERVCIHPKTKEKITIPQRLAPHFSSSSNLLKKINSGEI